MRGLALSMKDMNASYTRVIRTRSMKGLSNVSMM